MNRSFIVIGTLIYNYNINCKPIVQMIYIIIHKTTNSLSYKSRFKCSKIIFLEKNDTRLKLNLRQVQLNMPKTQRRRQDCNLVSFVLITLVITLTNRKSNSPADQSMWILLLFFTIEISYKILHILSI